MKSRKKIFIITILLCSYLLISCNQLTDMQAQAPDEAPQSNTTVQQNNDSAQQFSTYTQWVDNWLVREQNLPVGEWLVEKDEEASLSHYSGNKLDSQIVEVANMPFKKALRIKTTSAQNRPWDSGTKTITTATLNEGDAVLLTFWIRALASQGDQGAVYIILQDKASFESTIAEIIAVGNEWQQVVLRGAAPISSEPGKAILFFATGAQAQELEIGGIAALNYEDSVPLATLPQMALDSYLGQEPDAGWRAEAEARIDAHRKTDVKVAIVDQNGDPIENATVKLAMQKHAFVFGTSVNTSRLLDEDSDSTTYRKNLFNLDGRGHGFNATVIETNMKWWRWEAEDRDDKQDVLRAVDWLLDHDMPVRGHTLIWPGWSNLPNDLEERQNDPAYLFQRTAKRVTSMLGDPALNGRLYEWDVLNEPRVNNDLAMALEESGILQSGEQIYEQWFKLAAQSDNNTKLFINEYGILSEGALFVGQHEQYKQVIERLVENGDYLDGIGLQSHMDYPLTGPERIYSVLNEFAIYDKDIVITEYDLSLAYRNEPDLGEGVAAAYTRDFLTTIFSHPDVTGFLMWGYWDEIHWQDDSPMYRSDWSLKPAGEAFIDLVFNEWWTDESGVTDANGGYETRAFLGDYQVTVTVNGSSKITRATLTPENHIITITFDTEATTYSANLPFIASEN